QDVPISVSAVEGDELERQASPTIETLHNIVPNIRVFKIAGSTTSFGIYIRGIGRDLGYFNAEAPIAVYVDDVYYPYQMGPVIGVGGFERVETLRGPQGTLYGRNATVGAIKFVSQRPDLAGPTASYRLTAGNNGRREVQASAGAPLSDGTLAVRGDVAFNTYDGYMYDRVLKENVNGGESISTRLSLLWQPTEEFEVFLTAGGVMSDDELTLPTPIVYNADRTAVYPRFGDPFVTEHVAPDIGESDAANASAHLTLDLNTVRLKSITAFHGFRQRYASDHLARADIAYVGTVVSTHDHTFTQEFQATGSLLGDRLNYVSGLYYYESLTTGRFLQPGSANQNNNYNHQVSTSHAAYLDASFAITDKLTVSGGLRYTNDSKDLTQILTGLTTNFEVRADAQWDSVTPRLGVDYKLTDDILLYAAWGEGFKGGQFGTVQPGVIGAAGVFVPPETAKNREVGVKSSWFDHRLVLNMSYFETEYLDQSQSVLTPQLTTTLVTSDATIRGLELEGQARPLPQWSLNFALGALDSEYVNIQPGFPAYNTPDKTLKHAPELSYRIGTDYTFDALPWIGGDLVATASYAYISKTFTSITKDISVVQEPYGVWDADITYNFPNGRHSLTFFVNNASDEEYFKLVASGISQYYQAPREWGVTLRYAM
ncbi:MAG TPA: TonB-dependent receptor, partial [Caulobacteraceae bacterium]|nr:TonB-dependent receptor [Caulobacteraceae bacterium]